VLPRALPELSEALRGRRHDPFLLDPTGLHRWETLERLHELLETPGGAWEWQKLRYPSSSRLAAFLVDVLDARDDRVAASRRLVARLGLGEGAEHEITTLIEDPDLLLHVARGRSGFEEQSVIQLATHYGDAETARAAYVLASARSDDPLDRQALREMHTLIDEVMRAASWDTATQNLVNRNRRDAARLSDGSEAVLERIAGAPRGYVLLERPARVARHAAMLVRWRRRGRDQVIVSVGEQTRHDPRMTVDVVAPDRPGLLARVARVLTDAGLEIDHAIVATWPDGSALESFLVTAGQAPSSESLRDAIAAASTRPLTTEPVTGAHVVFDDSASPWYTVCRIDAEDRAGQLSAIAGALAASGVDVHSADVRVHGGTATDIFEVTAARGKLRADEREAIVANLRAGTELPGPRSNLGGLWDRLRGTWVSGPGQEEDTLSTS
jgi:UTP:GlnB (protein PII) uridylyltransferase